ncbi:MAG TPA: DegV family protein [Clostridiaceae bacterium]
MEKIKVITDSTCDLPSSLTDLLDIEVIPLEVHFGEESYKDGVNLKVLAFFDKIKTTNVFPTTSQINPQRFYECYNRYLNEGYSIISIHLSSKMSGTYQSACMAKEMLGSDKLVVIDSLNVTAGLGLLVLKTKELISEGFNIMETKLKIEVLRDKVKSILAFDSLEHLVKGGRLSKTAGLVGSVLGIKLLLSIKDGKLELIDKVRGTKKAIRKIIDYSKEISLSKEDKPILLHILSEEVRGSLKKYLEESRMDYIECEVGCVVATHSGPGACGLFFLEE